jgi:mannose-6-phosphate isomerase-like protein (cupin superfamily)
MPFPTGAACADVDGNAGTAHQVGPPGPALHDIRYFEGETTMAYALHERKGLAKCLVDADIDPEKLQLHISEIEPGTRAHPPHTHVGIEAFYVLEGHGTIEVEGERLSLGPNELAILDPSKLHGLFNTGEGKMRYMVVIARP